MAAEESALLDEEGSEDEDQTGQAPLMRRLAAEFVGTLLLVAVGAGVVTALRSGPLQALEKLKEIPGFAEGGNLTVFGSLLGNSFGDVLPVAFAFAVTLAVLVYAFGGTSGGHFNPAVTFGLAIVRRFSWKDLPGYWLAQVAGGIAGAFVIALIYRDAGASLGDVDILFGATTVSDTIDFWQAVVAEVFITFLLMTAIMAVAIDPRAPKGWSGLIIGLALGGGILVTDNLTGGSANFARSLGPFVASQFGFGDVGSIPWADLGVYALGPIIGAMAASLLYETVTGLEPVAPAPSPGAANVTDGLEEVTYTSPLTKPDESETTEMPPPAQEPPAAAPPANEDEQPPSG